MRKIGSAILVLAVVAAIALWLNSESPIRYRLTVTVASGDKTYTASGVIQISMGFQEFWSPPAIPHVTGDALVLEVPGHSPVFVLLRTPTSSDWSGSIPFELFRDRIPDAGSARERTRALLVLRDKAELPAKRFPTMVAFHDIADPKSVYQVVPNEMSPPLDPGARVVSMTIEMTRDSVTYQVEKILPWLPDTHNGYLDGDRYYKPGKSFANSLSQADFMKRGI